jgi:hypothetical protein
MAFLKILGQGVLIVLGLAGYLWIERAWEDHQRSVAEEMADCMRDAKGDVDLQVICVYGEDEGD